MTAITEDIVVTEETANAAAELLGAETIEVWGNGKFRFSVKRGEVTLTVTGRVFCEARNNGQWYYASELGKFGTGRKQYRFDDIACAGKGSRSTNVYYEFYRELVSLLN